MSLSIGDTHPFHELIIALVLGLLVGLQRQWADSPLGGIRTFALVSVLGTGCALLGEKLGSWIVVAGFLAVVAAMIPGHLRRPVDSKEHSGLVTEFAMLLTFIVGALVQIGPIWLAAAVAGIVAVTLQAKVELHGLAARFSEKELKSIMQFVLIGLVIFPIVPDQTFGPFDVLNPHDVWLMVLLIVGISLSGYIIYKFWGERAGVLLGGILGGLISSTATTMSHSKAFKAGSAVSQNALIIVIAWTTVYLRLLLEIGAAAPAFRAAWLPLGAIFLASAGSTIWVWRSSSNFQKGMPLQDNPTELKTALTFGLLYSLILFSVAFAKEYLGKSGLGLVAAISGITDMDAITLSTSRLVQSGKLPQVDGWPIIVIAAMSNTVFKAALVRVVGGKALFRAIALPLGAALCVGVGFLLFG